MKPIMLHGHERSITQIKYNREGDLLFSTAKDHTPNVWYSLNGERLGTYNGHTGAVWCNDVNWDSTRLATGAADNTCRLWDVQTGQTVSMINSPVSVRTCQFSYSGKMLLYSTDQIMGKQCMLHVVDITDESHISGGSTILTIPMHDKVTSAMWGPLDETIITGHDKGDIFIWDLKSQDKRTFCDNHKAQINDLQYNCDQTMFISASKDTTAKLFDTETLQHLKTFKTSRPVNSAAISPIRDHVVLGGGQEAMDVTTTSSKQGKFEALFFHLIFEEEFAKVKGHFGPINSVSFHPDGNSYASGGEDGYVRIHNFDPQYFDFEVEY